MDNVTRLKIVTRTWGERVVTIGKAFLNHKGIDGELWALPIANREGRYLFSLVGDGGPGPAASGMKLKVLLPRAYNGRDGEDKTQWNYIGQASMGDSILGELFVLPLPNRAEGVVRIVMREDDGRPAQPEGGYQAPRGQGAGRFARQPQAPQERPQAPQGPGLRPQHRDSLSGAQGAVYGGAAAQQSFGEAATRALEDDDPIPF